MPHKDPLKRKDYQYKLDLERQKLLRAIKSQPCTDCGQHFPHWVMEFDHVPERGERVTSPGAMRGRRLSEELLKCDVVCANCHKSRTWFRGEDRYNANND